MFDTRMKACWGWRGVLGFINPAVVLSLGSEISYKLGLEGVGMMEMTLGLVRATNDNMGKVLPGLDSAAKTLADQGAQFVCLGGPPATLVDGIDHIWSLKNALKILPDCLQRLPFYPLLTHSIPSQLKRL